MKHIPKNLLPSFKTPFKKGTDHILFGKPAWNSGKKMPHSKEWRENRIAASIIASAKRRGIPTGRRPAQKAIDAIRKWHKENPEKSRQQALKNLSRDGSGSLSKENSPAWRGGITEEWQKWKSNHGKDFEIWRNAVYARGGKMCRNCGSLNKVQAHHLISVSEFRQFAFLEMNGICLCFDCHKKTDSFGGRAIGKGKKNIGNVMAVIATIPHKYQSYNTVGNWDFGTDGSILIFVSEMKDARSELAVAIHELAEASACKKAGISPKTVTNFDLMFEEERRLGKHSPTDEPGDDKRAPYFSQHVGATFVEREVCSHSGLSWSDHESNVNEA